VTNYKVLIVEDDLALLEVVSAFLSMKGFSVAQATTRKECHEALQRSLPDAVVSDCHLPDTDGLQLLREIHAIDASIPVLIITGFATIDLAVRAIKEGAEQFLAKPFELSLLLKVLENIFEKSRSVRCELAVKNRVARFPRDPFLGTSESIVRLQSKAQSIVGTSLPILIQGEAGTGKGVLADWLTKEGPRSNEAFVDLNCSGLSSETLESELFGREEVPFGGVVAQKMGLLDVAHRGTLFLDELGDMDIHIQPKLLKVLDEGLFRRVAGLRDREVDIHLIAASNLDMATLVANDKFRRDLFSKVNTLSLVIPPLRTRIGDIPVIAQSFLEELEKDMSRGRLEFGKGVMTSLKGYGWPGNIRELRNVLERAALLCKDGIIRREDLHFYVPASVVTKDPRFVPCCESEDNVVTLKELERQYISFVLQKENGRAVRAAAKLAIPRTTFYAKLREHNISIHRDQ